MEWLNYHHLYYFWLVAREGGLGRASRQLRLAQSTVSKQIHQFEEVIGHALFEKIGRRLVLTESGRIAYRYAEEIFSLGRELNDTLQDRPAGRPLRLTIGIADVVPKLVALRVIEPATRSPESVRLICREDKPERLLNALVLHELDVVLTDSPASPGLKVKAYNHLLGDSDISFFCSADAAKRLKRGFPTSLDGEPMLLPTENTALRRALEQWLDANALRPQVVGEFEDSALLMAFGSRGKGVFPAPTVIASEIERELGVQAIGRLPQVRAHLYAVTVERRIAHPAVAVICETARLILQEAPR